MSSTEDLYAGASETTEGRVFTVTGQDWDQVAQDVAGPSWWSADERVVVNNCSQPRSTVGRSHNS